MRSHLPKCIDNILTSYVANDVNLSMVVIDTNQNCELYVGNRTPNGRRNFLMCIHRLFKIYNNTYEVFMEAVEEVSSWGSNRALHERVVQERKRAGQLFSSRSRSSIRIFFALEFTGTALLLKSSQKPPFLQRPSPLYEFRQMSKKQIGDASRTKTSLF
jgi:hypothetical protein